MQITEFQSTGGFFRAGSAPRKGYSLLELLAAIGIMGIVVILALPAITSVLQANRLTEGTQVIMNSLALARQTAITNNRPAILRFYRYADPTQPNETAGIPSTGRYRAVQVFSDTGRGSPTAAQRAWQLPVGVVITAGAWSTLLDVTATQMTLQTASATAPKLGSIGIDYQYQDLIFSPDGSIALPSSSNNMFWSITILSSRTPDDADELPPNFNTVVINTLNGTFRLYRP